MSAALAAVIDGLNTQITSLRTDLEATQRARESEGREWAARVEDLIGQLANSDAQKVYDALGLRDVGRCVGGVERYVYLQQNALKQSREREGDLTRRLSAVESNPAPDSYRSDLLKMMCAMVSSFHPAESFDPEKVAHVAGIAVDKAYVEASKRR